ncbi:MAG: antitoxin family protein [Dehalococcoidia bacterium]|nr:antitoxin family protein [Dehalococcoidia bacterium]
MTTHVRARYANGVLTPLEPLDLEEGAEVTVSVEGERAG